MASGGPSGQSRGHVEADEIFPLFEGPDYAGYFIITYISVLKGLGRRWMLTGSFEDVEHFPIFFVPVAQVGDRNIRDCQ